MGKSTLPRTGDGAAVSTGIKGQKGTRSAPTVYNAALHIARFWDGRKPDVERQAMGPPLSPIEMGMHDAKHIETVLTDDETGKIVTFLKALKGEIPHDYIKEPELPADGPDTPKK